MGEHIPGLLLCKRFYQEAVRPILDAGFPGLVHSAGLLGSGSEVLGFDTARSSDHHFGPRVILFLAEGELAGLAPQIDAALGLNLPVHFLGHSTNFSVPDPNDNGVRHPAPVEYGPVNHLIEITTARVYFQCQLGLDPWSEFALEDWLVFEEQRLRSLIDGQVFHDGLGELEPLRCKLAFYPTDVWLFLLAAEWAKIGQEEAFVGRTSEVGDELGSRLVTGRLVHSLMRLGFLMENQYPPYSKWFGAGFAHLVCAVTLTPALEGALAASAYPEREGYLCQAYEIVARMHNELGITAPVAVQPSFYFGRPFKVIHGGTIAGQIQKAIGDERIRRLPCIGSVNQYLSAVDVLDDVRLCGILRALYS
jgi:hypothetical protein